MTFTTLNSANEASLKSQDLVLVSGMFTGTNTDGTDGNLVPALAYNDIKYAAILYQKYSVVCQSISVNNNDPTTDTCSNKWEITETTLFN